MSSRKLLAGLFVALTVGACGGGHHTLTAPGNVVLSFPNLAQSCPKGQATMGCATPRPTKPQLQFASPVGAKFPDVSVWQGHPDWALAKPAIDGAAVKAGEYREDPDFAWNVAQFRALHIPWVAYWFVRNTGCPHEVAEIISVLHSVGGPQGPVVLDTEVPEAKGYVACMAGPLARVLHRPIEVYSAPGTWPGGANPGLDVWVASYGPSAPPCLFTCNVGVFGRQSILAWQYTDGKFGAVTNIPGIARPGDVSLDYGLMALAKPPPPPPPPPPATAKMTVTLAIKAGQWTVVGSSGALGRSNRWASAELQINEKTGKVRVAGVPWNSAPLGGR